MWSPEWMIALLKPQLTRGARGVAWLATTTTTPAAASAMFVVKRFLSVLLSLSGCGERARDLMSGYSP